MQKTRHDPSDEYMPHETCVRCSLKLNQDVCVCGWRRPRPDLEQKKRQTKDWPFKVVATVVVCAVLWWLLPQVAK